MRTRRSAAAVFLLVAGGGAAARAQEVDDAPFVRWAAAHALPVRSVEAGGSAADLRAVGRAIGDARVVALGEPTHGAHEPLAFRNRLFRYLVEELGFTAIALESGLPESRRLADFASGSAGSPPPGDAARVTLESLTWGFGNFAENAELVRWVRAYNADPSHRRKVRLYGIDLSLGGPQGSTPTPAAIEAALAYLARVDAPAARRARAGFAPYLSRLPGDGSAPFSAAEHDSLTAAIDDLIARLERGRAAYVAATSADDYAWAHRNAVVARQGDVLFRMQAPAAPGGGIPPGAWREISARDSAMADNVRWVLEREGPAGRVLVHAHNMHVKNAPTEGGVWRGLERPPTAMGQYLRAALGTRLVIVGSSAGPGGDAGSVDAALARVGVPRFVLDLRAARADRSAAAWLAGRRALRTNGDTFVTLSPAAAFDALFYVDSLTPSRGRRRGGARRDAGCGMRDEGTAARRHGGTAGRREGGNSCVPAAERQCHSERARRSRASRGTPRPAAECDAGRRVPVQSRGRRTRRGGRRRCNSAVIPPL